MSLNSAQAKMAARKRWDARPHRVCEVCGREHRCWQIEAEDEEAAVETLVKLFKKSLVVVKPKPAVVEEDSG
jgi:hypothetical protein